MTKRENKIRRAILELDPGKQSNWTAYGSPNLSVLRQRTAISDLSAHEVQAVIAKIRQEKLSVRALVLASLISQEGNAFF